MWNRFSFGLRNNDFLSDNLIEDSFLDDYYYYYGMGVEYPYFGIGNNLNSPFKKDYFSLTKVKYNKYREDNNVILEVALPGFKRENINIVIRDKDYILELSASKGDENKDSEKQRDFEIKQVDVCKINSCFEIPKETDLDNITCSFEDGILKVILPQKEAVFRKIEIK